LSPSAFVGLASLAVVLGGCGAAPYPTSAHFDGDRFLYPGVDNDKSIGDLAEWLVTREPVAWPETLPNRGRPALAVAPAGDTLTATWIGHSTFLLQVGTRTILTDPVFSDSVGPTSFLGPARVRPPGMSVEALPPIDAVVVSHDHYDHLDLPSILAIEARFHPVFVVPLGVASLLRSEGIENVRELDWWQTTGLDGTPRTRVTLTPALHWSGRGLGDRFATLWGAFYVDNDAGVRVYFGGDSGYAGHYRETFERMGAPDLALLPIGASSPRWFIKDNHLDAADALLAHEELHARHSIPMHWGTFQLGDEAWDDPAKKLADEAARRGLGEAFRAIEVGATWDRRDLARASVTGR
jgi:L-ascorbate metabolism protein UlaG (beta-lactamase superfamily)